MKIQSSAYSKGDWIVHTHYGVGQVRGIEKKVLDGENKLFFRVKTFDGVYWLSVVRTDVEYIRPITSEYQFKKALTIIRRPPKALPKDHNKRGKVITEALKDPDLYPKARMIRDLHARQQEHRLNFTEEDALVKMKKQLLNEWSVVQNTDREILEAKLTKALEVSLEKVAEST